MKWIQQGSSFIGDRRAEIRSIRIMTEEGRIKRYRVSTVRESLSDFTNIPAEGRLFKSERGEIGVFITGRNAGYVKIGSKFAVQQSIILPVNGISKKPLKKLLRKTAIEIIEIDGTMVGIEK